MKRSRWSRILLCSLGGVLVLGLGVLAADRVSPWPRVWLIRQLFAADAARTHAANGKHLPTGIAATLDLPYRPGDPDALLDLYRPAGAGAEQLPLIVWIHGGAFVAGHRRELADYGQVLAARGFAVACLGYSLAPEHRYPTPLQQANAALGWLGAQASALGIDPRRVLLAGDSAGAQLAAQLAACTTDPAYAQRVGIAPALDPARLCGVILCCGPYDLHLPDYEGPAGAFLKPVLWAYSGRRDFLADPDFLTMSVAQHLSAAFPPAFVTAGNADPLESQSRAFAARLAELGVAVDTLFFPADHQPALGHEYQLKLDLAEAQQALQRIVAFAERRTRR